MDFKSALCEKVWAGERTVLIYESKEGKEMTLVKIQAWVILNIKMYEKHTIQYFLLQHTFRTWNHLRVKKTVEYLFPPASVVTTLSKARSDISWMLPLIYDCSINTERVPLHQADLILTRISKWHQETRQESRLMLASTELNYFYFLLYCNYLISSFIPVEVHSPATLLVFTFYD